MAVVIFAWDTAELLDSPAAISAYIEAAFEDGDTALISYALGVVARVCGMGQLARDTWMSRDAV